MSAARQAWTLWACALVLYALSVFCAAVGFVLWPLIGGLAVGCLTRGTYLYGYHRGRAEHWADAWDGRGDDIFDWNLDWDGNGEWPRMNHKKRQTHP